MNTRAVIRTAFIVAFTAVCMVCNGTDVLLPWHPFSSYGFSAVRSGQVTTVDLAAARSGLAAGDRIVVSLLRPAERVNFGYFTVAPEGAMMHVALSNGKTLNLRSHLYVRSAADNISDVIAVTALLAYIALAAMLVLLRPTPATWAFYAFSFAFCFSATLIVAYAPPTLAAAVLTLHRIALAISGTALIAFALRFPDVRPTGLWVRLERALLFVIAPALAAWSAITYLLFVSNAYLAPDWPSVVYNILINAIFGCGVTVLLVRYATAGAADRNRLQWVVAAFTVAFLPLVVVFFVEGFGVFPEVTIINVAQAWTLLAPIALAYTVLRHRLFDVRFVFSRALMYAILTSVTVGILALVDWGFGRWLATSRFALIGELALALLLGIALTTAHRRIERFLNSVIFRAQMLALQALRRFAQETDLIADPQRLLTQTHEALDSRLESEYAAIYTEDGSSYALSSPSSGAVPQFFPGDDLVLLRLRRWHEAFECDEPKHPLRGALVLPMTARGHLVGFIVCGPKFDRTHYLPEEIETLEALAQRTAAAYAWLTLRPAAQPLAVPTQ